MVRHGGEKARTPPADDSKPGSAPDRPRPDAAGGPPPPPLLLFNNLAPDQPIGHHLRGVDRAGDAEAAQHPESRGHGCRARAWRMLPSLPPCQAPSPSNKPACRRATGARQGAGGLAGGFMADLEASVVKKLDHGLHTGDPQRPPARVLARYCRCRAMWRSISG